MEEVNYTDFVPLSTTAGPYNFVRVDGYTPAPGESTSVNRALVAPEYFATMRIPLLEGRDFNARDERKTERVMIVNQAFAKRFFHGQSPLGRKVRARGPIVHRGGSGEGQQIFYSRGIRAPLFLPGVSAVLRLPARNSTFWCGRRANRHRRFR